MGARRVGFEIDEVKQHHRWFMVFGTVMIAIGFAQIGWSVVTATFPGWVLVCAGICQLVHSIARRRWSGPFLNLPSGVLYFVTGLLMLCDPAIDTVARARVLSALLITIGVARLFVALSIPLKHHSWLIHAVTAIISGFMILNSWPVAGPWRIGLLVDFNMMIEGWVEITLARTTAD
jgi:uncharacterized membrane protein HdeD (DUF308 family)